MSLVVFSCEIGAREYLPRIYLGLRLASLGVTTLVGHKFSISSILRQMKGPVRGMFIHKDLNSDATKYLSIARERGLAVGGTDEELLNVNSTLESRLIGNEVNQELADFSIASTEVTAALFQERGFKPLLLGNLRIALCESYRQFRNSASSGSGRRESMVLVNSPCSLIFSGYPFFNHLEMRSRLIGFDAPYEFNKLKSYIGHEFDFYQSLMEALEMCSDQRKITVRAHPGENPSGLRLLLGKSMQEIDFDPGTDSVLMTLSKSGMLYACNCTTLLEAYTCGLPFKNIGRELGRNEDTLTDRFFERVGLRDAFEAIDEQHAGFDSNPDLDSILLMPVLPKWLTFITEFFGREVASVPELTQKFTGLNPRVSPDVERRRGCITREQLSFAISLAKRECNLEGIGVRVHSPDCVSIVPR